MAAREMNALAIGAVATTLASVVTLVVLFVGTASDLRNGDDDDDHSGDGGGSQDNWWEFDMRREEQEAFKVAANVAVLGAVCASLLAPMVRIWHPSKGAYDRFHLGALAASAFLVSNMLFVSFCFWFSASRARRDDENGSNDNDDNNDNDDGNNDDDGEMDEEELLAYHQKRVSTVSLVLALVLSALSAVVFAVGRKLPEPGRDDIEAHARVRSAAHTELLSEIWKLLSSVTVSVLWILFCVACLLSLGEEGERRREEQGGDVVFVLLWAIVVTLGMTALGRKVLGQKALGTLGAGLLSGGTAYYAMLLFATCIPFADPELGGRGGAGGGAAVACFFLGLMHLLFSLGAWRYRESIMSGAREDEGGEADDVEDESVSTEFRRMEGDDASEAGSERGTELT